MEFLIKYATLSRHSMITKNTTVAAMPLRVSLSNLVFIFEFPLDNSSLPRHSPDGYSVFLEVSVAALIDTPCRRSKHKSGHRETGGWKMDEAGWWQRNR